MQSSYNVGIFSFVESNRNSGSSSSSAVLVEKSECKALDDDDNDDVDIDLDEDINEEELKKIMDKIKNKSGEIDVSFNLLYLLVSGRMLTCSSSFLPINYNWSLE